METRILIIHGYSDCSTSFAALKQHLVQSGAGSVETIFYADYESTEDSLTLNDVADGLNDQLISQELIRNDGSSDYKLKIIVHSTGGLVVRHWLWRYYRCADRLQNIPVSHIVMLAPANFGSPLAHRGKSFLGSLVKGRWKVGDFLEVGRKILDSLELASPQQWDLAHKDLLVKDNYFNADQVKTTIIVGNRDYDGIRSWVNKPGTDGTVVLSGTSINSLKLCLQFADPTGDYTITKPHHWSSINNVSDIAFGIYPGLDHGSIVDEAGAGGRLSEILTQALNVTGKTEFDTLKEILADCTTSAYSGSYENLPLFQQFILHAVDDYGLSVSDFTIEFFMCSKANPLFVDGSERDLDDDEDYYSKEINAILTGEVHQNTCDKSFRRLLINYNELTALIEKIGGVYPAGFVISMKIFVPPVEKGIRYNCERLQNIVIYDSTAVVDGSIPQFFFPNTTTLIELQVDRTNKYMVVDIEPRKHDKW